MKIAVLRANGLGDFIVSLPALHALRSRYPDAEIVLLAKPWTRDYAKNRGLPFDRVMVPPVSHGVRLEPDQHEDPEELEAFFAQMQQERFDIAIQIHGGGQNSNPFIFRLHAGLTVGLATASAPKPDRWIPYVYYQHEVTRYLEVMALLDAHTPILSPRIPVLESDRTSLHQQLPDLKTPYAVLHPGASDPRRRWEPEKFAAVADALSEKGLTVVLTGIPEEADTLSKVMKQMTHSPVNACGIVSLESLNALIADAKIVVSNDTGVTHLARAVDTPNVGIYWGPNLINWGPLTRTRNRTVESWLVICQVCGKNYGEAFPIETSNKDCGHISTFVSEVTIAQVMREVTNLLSY